MSAVAVIGAGIAGLAIAHRLSAAHDVTVFEREAYAGGKIHSQSIDGYLFDWGPNGFLSGAAELQALVRDAGLGGEVAEADAAAENRYIFWAGALHKLPSKPPQALRGSLISPLGKVRALAELIVPRRAPSDAAHDETVFAFFERRFGREVAERVVAPAVLGISGGDAATTSIDALFPRVRAFETEHGSVIRGLMRNRRSPGRLSSFGAGGMQRLTDRLAERLGNRVRFGLPVERIAPEGGGWRIEHRGGELRADVAIVATPADAAATIVDGFDAELAAALGAIPYAPMRAIGIAFRRDDVRVPLDGFGFLAARGQGVRILGAVYTSTIYPDQAPPGAVYLRVFMGGATDLEAGALDARAVQAIVRRDLATTLGIDAEPIAVHDYVWQRAIPQYALAHRGLVRTIDERAKAHRGLAFAGNAYRGIGLADTVRSALAVAADVERFA